MPERLSRWQWVDLFVEEGYQRLQRSLEAHSVPGASARKQMPIDALDEARPAASDQGPVTARFDGMYTQAGEDMSRFIRFFPPNTAVSVTVDSEPLATLMPKVDRWLRPGDPELGEGMFEIDGESIRWDDTSSHGTVLYRGTISAAGT